MEFVQERVTTLHDFGDAPVRADGLDDVATIVPVAQPDTGSRIEDVLDTLAAADPARLVVPFRSPPDEAAAYAAWLRDRSANVLPLWCNAPAVDRILMDAGIGSTGGKGRDVWLALGPAAAAGSTVAIRDADARHDGVERPVERLVAARSIGYEFVKGYYARVEDRLYGRLNRLLFAPVVRALAVTTDDPLIRYLDAFRYPLSGEVALSADLARSVRVEPGFGLEVGMLGAVYQRCGPDAVAQVDLGRHRHDHRPVEGADGLASMAEAVVAALLRTLEDAGMSVEVADLRDRYERAADRLIAAYEADASFNALPYDAEAERAQVDRYRDAIRSVTTDPRLPPWDAVDVDPAAIGDAAQPGE